MFSIHSQVRSLACNDEKWLLVNLQNVAEFACQVLNRDVWSHRVVRELLGKKFLLWQIYHDGESGLKYQQFYPVSNWPHIAIIDPMTGWCVRSFYLNFLD